MSIFAENITNSDDVVLSEFRLAYDNVYKCHYLQHLSNKFSSSYLSPSYVPVDIIWKHYMREGYSDEVKYKFGFNIQPNKNDFTRYVSQYNGIKKLVFKNEVYYAQNYLIEMFEHYNEHVVEQYLRKRFNNR